MHLPNILKSKHIVLLLISLGCFFSGLYLSHRVILPPSPGKLALKFSHELTHRNEALGKSMLQFQKLCENSTLVTIPDNKLFLQWNKQGFSFYLFDHDSLIYWSDNTVPVPDLNTIPVSNSTVIHLANGWYLARDIPLRSHLTLKGLALIRYDYPYENQYLKNEFHSSFSAISTDSISFTPPGFPVYTLSTGKSLYYHPSEERTLTQRSFYLVFSLLVLGTVFLLIYIYRAAGSFSVYRDRRVLFFFAFAADVVILRMLFFWFQVPAFFYSTELFSPYSFAASSFLPSLGDFFIHAVFVLFLSALFFREFRNRNITVHSVLVRWTLRTVLPLLVLILFYLLILSFDLLITNSSFSLLLARTFTLTYQVLISFLILVFLTASFFFIVYPLLRILYQSLPQRTYWMVALLGLITLLLAVLLYIESLPMIGPVIIFIAVGIFIFYRFRHPTAEFTFTSLFYYILVFSLLATILVLDLDQKKELSQRKLLVQKLSSERDPLAEFLIQEATEGMIHDPYLKSLLTRSPFTDTLEQEATTYLSRKYFGNYWQKYNLDFTFCTKERILNVVVPNNALINCQDYFGNLVKAIGKPTISGNLYFLDYGTGSINYLAVIPFEFDSLHPEINHTLYIDITSKRIPKGLGYPELLISKESLMIPVLNHYSYAIYKKDNLIRSVGKYTYSLNLDRYGHFTDRFIEFEKNQYCHLIYKVDREKSIIISLKSRTFLDNMAPFSYFSLLFSLLTILFIFSLTSSEQFSFQNLSFRYRLQFSMILLIIFSFITVGIISGFYIVRLNQGKNIDNLTEKAHSILTEIQQKLGGSDKLSPEMANDLYFLLNKFSLIFFSDINLYDLNGNLLASSRPQIFEEGLIAHQMNRQSLQELSVHQKSLYIHQDKIGNYSFLSAYLPFRNDQDALIGYLNLPYFARQDEIRSELSSFLVAYINMYVLLVAISVLLAIIISKYISKPVLQIRDHISEMKLGRPNEKIEWQAHDEIGALVEEYNHMIDQLAFSAEQLAQTERESAWREMARQVAHEIKNPLTPMKLSVQHLIKSYEEKAPDWEQRLQRFSKTLIEQIDNLSDIASEFSDFAKMPQLKKERLNIKEVIESVIILYRTQPDLTFSLDIPGDIQGYMEGDKNQLMRALMNLVKNSVQAMHPDKEGNITIRLSEDPGFLCLEVEDNGTGMTEEQQSRVFSPNFTTKTGGMGLGLAMVRSIITDHHGSISFRSEEGRGTMFLIKLPSSRAEGE